MIETESDFYQAERRSRAREKAEANAAVLAMQARRPLAPPSRRWVVGEMRTAAQLSLAKDRRLGLVDE